MDKNELIVLPTLPLDELSDDEWVELVDASRTSFRKLLHPDTFKRQTKYTKAELHALYLLMEAVHAELRNL